MLKKKYNFQNQVIIKYNYKKNFVSSLITNSLKTNHSLIPIARLSLFGNSNLTDDFFFNFSTYQTLVCLISLSPKVHNKKISYSRFFFNKQLERLTISNTLK
jgi:hypothetical protein